MAREELAFHIGKKKKEKKKEEENHKKAHTKNPTRPVSGRELTTALQFHFMAACSLSRSPIKAKQAHPALLSYLPVQPVPLGYLLFSRFTRTRAGQTHVPGQKEGPSTQQERKIKHSTPTKIKTKPKSVSV